jgi:hypothetical protein
LESDSVVAFNIVAGRSIAKCGGFFDAPLVVPVPIPARFAVQKCCLCTVPLFPNFHRSGTIHFSVVGELVEVPQS